MNSQQLIDISIELIKSGLMDGEFSSWTTEWDTINSEGAFVMKGNLNTIESCLKGKANVTYFGCTFKLSCTDDIANWGFDVKCESELFSIKNKENTIDSGNNWSNCIIPSLFRPYDIRKENFDRVSEAIFEAI